MVKIKELGLVEKECLINCLSLRRQRLLSNRRKIINDNHINTHRLELKKTTDEIITIVDILKKLGVRTFSSI